MVETRPCWGLLLPIDGSCVGAFDEAIALVLIEGPQAQELWQL